LEGGTDVGRNQGNFMWFAAEYFGLTIKKGASAVDPSNWPANALDGNAGRSFSDRNRGVFECPSSRVRRIDAALTNPDYWLAGMSTVGYNNGTTSRHMWVYSYDRMDQVGTTEFTFNLDTVYLEHLFDAREWMFTHANNHMANAWPAGANVTLGDGSVSWVGIANMFSIGIGWNPGYVAGGENRAVPANSITQYWGFGNLGSPSGAEDPPGWLRTYGPNHMQTSSDIANRDAFGYSR